MEKKAACVKKEPKLSPMRPLAAALLLLSSGESSSSSSTLLQTVKNVTVYYTVDGHGFPPDLLVARDALGAAVAHAESPSDGTGTVEQVVVEVNTLWAPFAESCSITNSTQISATWSCRQPALRGELNASDTVVCDCNQHSMMYPLAEFAHQCACHRMLELAVGRLDLNLSAQRMLANDTSRSLSRSLRFALGGTALSLQKAGLCSAGDSSPGPPCTWRVVSRGGSVSTAKITAALERLVASSASGASCLTGCGKSNAACRQRCTAIGLGNAGPAPVSAAWQKLFATAEAAGTTPSLGGSQLTTGTQRMALYRLAPAALAVDLVNADSGGVAGDVFFGVMEAQLQCYNSAKNGSKPELFSCQDDPMSEGKALRLGTAVYTRFEVRSNTPQRCLRLPAVCNPLCIVTHPALIAAGRREQSMVRL